MSHPPEQDLVSFLDADPAEGAAIEAHLEQCPACRLRLDALRGVIAMTRELRVPEPDPGFEERIWARQRAELVARGTIVAGRPEGAAPLGRAGMPGRDPRRAWLRRPRMRDLVVVGSLAAALVLAFVIGLYTPPPGSAPVPAPNAFEAEDQALLIALGGHLERSRRVLVEVSNARIFDVSTLALQQNRARELIADGRLYRQSAVIAGLPEYAAILEEIERVLLELTRGGPGAMTPDRLEWLRARIGERDLLFRSRVLQTHATDRPGPAAPRVGEPLA